MAKFLKQQNQWVLSLNASEAQSLGLKERDFDLLKAKDGLLLLVEKPVDPQLEKNRLLDQRVLSLLDQKSLQDRVEGQFESFLSKEELIRLKELIQFGKVELFKLSPQYKKPVYQLKEQSDSKKPLDSVPSQDSATLDSVDECIQSLEKRGFAVAKGEQLARELSQQLSESIQDREVMGIRSFDGNFYIASESFFGINAKKLENVFSKQKTATVEELAQKTGIPRDGIKTLTELLKQEGTLIEKRKDFLQWIG